MIKKHIPPEKRDNVRLQNESMSLPGKSNMPYQQEINDYLNRHVPLFRAMEAQLARCDATGVGMRAPLAPNINDKGIAFGGSMAALSLIHI